jgi:hypothetical protein
VILAGTPSWRMSAAKSSLRHHLWLGGPGKRSPYWTPRPLLHGCGSLQPVRPGARSGRAGAACVAPCHTPAYVRGIRASAAGSAGPRPRPERARAAYGPDARIRGKGAACTFALHAPDGCSDSSDRAARGSTCRHSRAAPCRRRCRVNRRNPVARATVGRRELILARWSVWSQRERRFRPFGDLLSRD